MTRLFQYLSKTVSITRITRDDPAVHASMPSECNRIAVTPPKMKQAEFEEGLVAHQQAQGCNRICTCPRPYSCRSTRPLMSLERMQIQFCYFIFIDWSPGMYSAWLQFSYLFADSSFSFSWVFNAPLAWISSLREPTKFFRSSRKRFATVAGARHEVGRGRRHYSGPIKITRERAGAVRGHWANCY